ncbi:MAG: endolytic transglycosylase MltG [Pseudopedobacter saltans]|uniref:Endolytic murein transglycosylase n=1 Tax=Pseudopedobacter saltans TaxID=151895 RepID=A0A2W5EFH8_9SPHI|nr:MAG: endolytic transglycosylase MltG [Pseudopedobacter saltans]
MLLPLFRTEGIPKNNKICFMKKIVLVILVLIILAGGIGYAMLGMNATKFDAQHKFIYVSSKSSAKDTVLSQLSGADGISNIGLFSFVTDRLHIWDRIKTGRFEIKKGSSLKSIIMMFRRNEQAPAKLVINKLRTRADLAGLIGRQFKLDSLNALSFLDNNDSLKVLGVDTNTVMSLVIPDTYLLNWNSSMRSIMERLQDYQKNFWSSDGRTEKATKLGLTPLQVYIFASIVEEETNNNAEKGNVASVYYNRYKTDMPLGADPTIRFALNDFTIKRVLSGHLQVQSPYNTYKNKGLPPGPICTPSQKTIDAVLNQPSTKYLFFVAKSDFSGTHEFSETFQQHVQYANQYRQELDKRMAAKDSLKKQ